MTEFLDIITSEWFISIVSLLLGRFIVPFIPINLLNRIRKGGEDLVKVIDIIEDLDTDVVRDRLVSDGLKEGSKLLEKYLGAKDA